MVDDHVAGVLLIAARDGAGAALYQMAGDAPGLGRALMPTIDVTRTPARLGFRTLPARALGPPGSAAAALTRVLDTGMAALAAEAVGGAPPSPTASAFRRRAAGRSRRARSPRRRCHCRRGCRWRSRARRW